MRIEENKLCGILIEEIEARSETVKKDKSGMPGGDRQLAVAIDGRCASGKTTLAMQLKEKLHCNVVSMDHFFPQPHQRTPERFKTPGGNVDYERVLSEIMSPLSKGEPVCYRPYNCHSRKFDEEIRLDSHRLTIVEGSYSCHPALWDYYDLRIFLSVGQEEQLRRIVLRNGPEAANVFEQRWIPLEEAYLSEFHIEERCDFCAVTG